MIPKVVRQNGVHELFMSTYVVVVGQRYYWRASEASETLSGVYKFELVRYIYIYLITLIPRNITSQLQCISASTAVTSAIPVTDE